MNEPDLAAATIESRQTTPLGVTEPRRGFAIGLIVASSVVISFGGLIIRNIDQPDPWQINFYRSLALITAVMLILVFQYRRNTISYVRNIGYAGLLAGGMLAAASIFFIHALTHTTVANTLFTLSAIPFITAALARVFLKEGLPRATLIAMFVAAIGIFVMMVEGFGIGSAFGNVMALATAVFFSGFAVIIRHNRRIDMMPTVLVSGVIIALIALPVRLGDLGISLNDLLLCFLWGGVLSGFANWMFINASRHLVAAEVTLFLLLELALGPAWVWLFVGEVPTQWTLVGGGLVIAAVTIRAINELRRPSQPLKRGRPSPI